MANPQLSKIIIVGAGMGGLSSAVSLRRQNKHVTILEQAPEIVEVGAAVSLAPNCTRLLLSLGFSSEKAQCVNAGISYEYNSKGEVVNNYDVAKLAKDVGYPWWWIHRADLHKELMRLATEEEGEGPKVEVKLDSKVVKVDCEEGMVTTEKGDHYAADLIIGGDGVTSACRAAVTGRGHEEKTVYSGHTAYRGLWDMDKVKKDPELAEFIDEIKMDDWVGKDGRRCLIYPCRDNELLNLFAPVPMSEDVMDSDIGEGKAEDLVEAFKDFPVKFKKLLQVDPKPGLWQIRDRDPIKGWSKAKVVLLGDAAHPMLPHQGQGAGQSIEDAYALTFLLLGGSKKLSLKERLEGYEQFRHARTTAVQKRSREQKKGPYVREDHPDGKPSLHIWEDADEQCRYDVGAEAKKFVEAL